MKAITFMSVLFMATVSWAQPQINAAAPAFSEVDAAGKTHALSDYKGKWVVLEWYNKDCPFVKKHYGSKNMQKLQEDYTAKGVVWLTVISSAKGEQGYLDPAAALEDAKKTGSKATAVLIDEDGTMGKAYDARVTPHMYVINPQGNLVYMGAIDDNSSSNAKVIAKSENYVKSALDAAMAGKEVKTTVTKAYGCTVKYK